MRNLESYNLTRRQYLREEITSGDFLGLRGEIAAQVSGGNDEVVNHFARKSARLWLCSQKYDRHFIDGVSFPGFYEAIYATFKIKDVADLVARNFSNVSGLMLVGSCAWGANYALKMSEVSDRIDSDIDFEVILGRKEDWDMVSSSPLLRQDSKFIRGFSSFRQLHEQGLADYFSHKIIINEVETSLHFTPFTTLISLCRFPLSDFEGISTFREIRVIPKTKPSLYNLSNFRRRRYPFDCVIEQINDLILTYTPKQVTLGGELYLGVLANKLLHAPLILRDEIGKRQELLHLTTEVIKRIMREESRFGDQRFLTSGLVESSITPRYILKHLEDTEYKLRGDLSLK